MLAAGVVIPDNLMEPALARWRRHALPKSSAETPMSNDRQTLRRQMLILTGLMIVFFPFRLLPYLVEVHEGWLMCLWGASPVLAMFLLSVAKCRSRWVAVALPLAGFILTDLVIETILVSRNLPSSSLRGRLFIYGLYLVLSQLGLIVRAVKGPAVNRIVAGVGAGMAGSVAFFLVTNFLIWLRSTPADGVYYYAPTWEGLVKCYTMALPFFQNQFLYDAVFAALLFSAYEVCERVLVARTARRPALAEV
jgi:hypothetical protein